MSDADFESIWTTTIRQHPERTVPDLAQEFLAQGYVAHIGFEQDGLPYVIPMLYQYSVERPESALCTWRVDQPDRSGILRRACRFARR